MCEKSVKIGHFSHVFHMVFHIHTPSSGKKQCSNSGRKRNDIDPLESDFMVQPPSLLEFPGPLTPPPPWNFQFPLWWGSGYFLEPHNEANSLRKMGEILPSSRSSISVKQSALCNATTTTSL